MQKIACLYNKNTFKENRYAGILRNTSYNDSIANNLVIVLFGQLKFEQLVRICFSIRFCTCNEQKNCPGNRSSISPPKFSHLTENSSRIYYNTLVSIAAYCSLRIIIHIPSFSLNPIQFHRQQLLSNTYLCALASQLMKRNNFRTSRH